MHTFKKRNGLVSANQRAKDQRPSHQPDNVKSNNNFLTNKKSLETWQLWFQITYSGKNKCVNAFLEM